MQAADRMRSGTERGLDGRPVPGAHLETAARVEPVVQTLIGAYEELIGLLEEHRAAISRADTRGLGAAVERERDVLTRIDSLETEFRAALGEGPATLTSLAQAVGGVEGSRLAESAAYLRALAGRARVLQAAVREASESMATHINGLMRQVAARLSHAGTYGSGGRVESGSPVVSGLDLSL